MAEAEFISAEQMQRDHAGLPHGGSVIRTGVTGLDKEHSHVIEYSIKLDSNPEFTAGALVASARAVYRLAGEGKSGCFTMFDLPPAYLSAKTAEELRRELL